MVFEQVHTDLEALGYQVQMGFPTNWTELPFSKWRRKSIKLYGNAIVPQIAIELFKAIETAMKQ